LKVLRAKNNEGKVPRGVPRGGCRHPAKHSPGGGRGSLFTLGTLKENERGNPGIGVRRISVGEGGTKLNSPHLKGPRYKAAAAKGCVTSPSQSRKGLQGSRLLQHQRGRKKK